MTDTTAVSTPARRRIGPTALKLVWLAGLAIGMLIPNYMTSSLIDEREGNEQLAKQAIAHSWGPAQTVTSPMLMVLMKSASTVPGQTITTYVRFAPKTLETEIEVVPEQRHRGFFAATVYTAKVHLKGTFALPDAIPASDGSSLSLPDSGFLAVTLSDLAGVASADRATVGGTAATWRGLPDRNLAGCHTPGAVLVVPTSLAGSHASLPFEATLHLRGTEQIEIGVLAKAMNATIKGAWASPSFTGDEPPVKAAISKDGFLAQWHLDGLDEPGFTTSACVVDRSNTISTIGVSLVDSVPVYRMVTRAAKYAPLFVVLAFTAYFVFELATRVAITIVQYALMAASLSLFALLLVSFSEFTGYTTGYVAAAALVIIQASIYTASVARRVRPGLGFAALLAGLFGFLYVLLGLEVFALLTGAIALFILLSVVMAATQKVYGRDVEMV